MNKPAQSAVPGAISQGGEPPRTAAGAWFRWATINGDSILVFLLIPSRSLHLGGGFLVFSGGAICVHLWLHLFFAWPTDCEQLIKTTTMVTSDHARTHAEGGQVEPVFGGCVVRLAL